MHKYLRKLIGFYLILALILPRVGFAVPFAYADDQTSIPPVPTMPPMPSAPPPPTAPQINYTLPTNPPAPINSTSVPTVPPQPTQETVQNLPTGTTLPTESVNGTASSTQNNSADSSSNGNPSTSEGQGQNTNGSYTASGNSSVNDPANILTGSGSINNAEEKANSFQEKINKNVAELQNKIENISSTGFNYSNLNTLDGNVFSGDATAQLNLLNKLNSNITGLGGFAVYNVYDTYVGDIVFKLASDGVSGSFTNASSNVSQNVVTGPGSTNNATAENIFTVKEVNGNDAKLINDIMLQAVSGSNSASNNTGNGEIVTGNATVVGSIINLANTNLNVTEWLFGVVNVWGELIGNILLPKDTVSNTQNSTSSAVVTANNNTGSSSTNNSTYNSENIANFNNVNDAVITSIVDSSVNSGKNTASANTGGGVVNSGNTDVSISDSTIANNNVNNAEETVWMIIVNEAGKWVGHIIGSPNGATNASNSLPISQSNGGSGGQTSTVLVENQNTGTLSDNNSSFSDTSNISVTNNNTASITNNITASADTGNNTAAFNTGQGNIETGDAKVGLNLVNMANTNVTAKKFIAVLVNVLGSFIGDIVPPDQQEAQNTVPSNIGGIQDSSNQIVNNTGNSTSNSTADAVSPPVFTTITDSSISYTTSYQTPNQVMQNNISSVEGQYASQYYQAYQQFMASKAKTTNWQKKAVTYLSDQQYLNSQKKIKRGLFLSLNFTKATESSFTGMLFGGASLKVNQSWLSIIPFAVIFVLFRRRKNINISRYLNAFLELIL